MIRKAPKYILKKANSEEETVEVTLEWVMSGVDLERRRIEIRSEINEIVTSIITRALMQMSEISLEPITIFLSSPGGDVNQGLAIYDFIRACPCDVHIVASGQIMSMGFIIFLAGDTRVAMPNTRFMMHSLSYSPGETPKIVRNHEIDVLEGKLLNNNMLEIMDERTNRNKRYWYRTVLLQDKYFGVAEAKELGIIKEKAVKPVAKKKVRKNAKV